MATSTTSPQEQLSAWREYDFALTIFLGMVLVLGVTAVFSASSSGRPEFYRQLIYIVIGFGVLVYLSLSDYRSLGRLYGLTYAVILLSLLIVRLFGHATLGAVRQVDLGLFAIQPSEISKLLLIIVLARFFNDRRQKMRSPSTFLLGAAFLLPPTVLILAQPDLGTALVYVGIFYGMAFMAGVPKRYVFGSVLLIGAALPIIISRLHGYQQQRLIVFFNPGADPTGAGYNILQAKIAVGSGGLFGKGFLTGTQGQLGFLPIRVTDFIFAIFTEEWGFIGGFVLILLFMMLAARLLRAAHLARDQFGTLLALGITAMILFQVVVNIGMNLGVMPVVGIPLPFISYGGSSMVTNLAGIGIVQSILIRHKDVRF